MEGHAVPFVEMREVLPQDGVEGRAGLANLATEVLRRLLFDLRASGGPQPLG